MHLLTASFTALCLSLLTSTGMAQGAAPSTARDEEIRRLMESTSNSIVPSVARMADAVLDTELKFAERPDTALRIAAFKRNLYDALLKKGFTAEQSMQILLNTPLPSTAAGAK